MSRLDEEHITYKLVDKVDYQEREILITSYQDWIDVERNLTDTFYEVRVDGEYLQHGFVQPEDALEHARVAITSGDHTT